MARRKGSGVGEVRAHAPRTLGLAPRNDKGRELGLTAFGLGLLSDVTPPGAWVQRPLAEPTLRLRSASSRAIAESWSGLDAIGWEGMIDGAPFVVERGRAGDHRFVHGAHPHQSGTLSAGTRAVHHLSTDARVLRCAPSDPAEQSWWRVVLDSVLFTVALLQGYEALHAGALATPDGAVAITAASGGGKSTLLSELLAHGLTLAADDVLVLEPSSTDAPPLAHPAPPLMTVPAARLPRLAAASCPAETGSSEAGPPEARADADASQTETGPPEAICALGEERWIPVPVHPEPLPLKALVVLNRRPGLATGMHRAARPLAVLVGSLLRFPRVPERERTRFEVAGAIAAHVPIWRLDADPSVAPETLAGLLLAECVEPHRTRPQSLSTVR